LVTLFVYLCNNDDKKIVRVIARRTLREFWENHADSEDALKAWYHEAEKATW